MLSIVTYGEARPASETPRPSTESIEEPPSGHALRDEELLRWADPPELDTYRPFFF